jgi:hypothetical protein
MSRPTKSASGADKTPLLVFFHIPKTAGTTMTAILRANEPGHRTLRAGNVFKGGGGVNREVKFETLRRRARPGLEGVAVLTGHFPIGNLRYLPDEVDESRSLSLFTILREPVDRTLSHYFQIKETAAADRAQGRERAKRGAFGLAPLPEDPSLEDTIKAGYIQDNLQTRMLCGESEPFGEVTDEMLERAKEALEERMNVFGLTERFDESLVLARRKLGLRTIIHRSSGRVSSSRPRGDDVKASLREAAAEANVHDLELYRYATELFEALPELGELDFQIDVAALRAARASGEIDAEEPAPESYPGGGDEWKMLLAARASILRCDEELAAMKAAAYELAERVGEQLARVDAQTQGIALKQDRHFAYVERAEKKREKLSVKRGATKADRVAMKAERRALRKGAGGG